MLWRISIYLIFMFNYTSNGQIVLVSSTNQSSNGKQMLSGYLEHTEGPLKTLKAMRPDDDNMLPSQWALGDEGSTRFPDGNIRVYIDSDSYGDGIAGRVISVFSKIQASSESYCPSITRLMEKPTDGAGSWLHFTNPDRVRECVHDAGLDDNGEIKIVLGYDCLKPWQIMHTILHGLGFRDEVTHPRRDLFVRVMWENIQPAFRSMFRIQPVETNDASLMEYDPMSVMHFHDRAYSVNGQATIMPMLPGLRIEPADSLSHLDAIKIKRMFSHECKKRQVSNVIQSACAGWQDELKGDLDQNKFKGNGCPTDYNNGNPVTIPNFDAIQETDYDGQSEKEQIVIPGNDVGSMDDEVADNEVSGEGNDLGVDDENLSVDAGDGNQIVVPGNNVKVDNGSPNKKLSAKLSMSGGPHISDDEVIVVGYDPSHERNRK